MLRFWPLVLLTTAVLAFTACEDAQEVLPSASATAEPSAAASVSPNPTLSPSATQTPIPCPTGDCSRIAMHMDGPSEVPRGGSAVYLLSYEVRSVANTGVIVSYPGAFQYVSSRLVAGTGQIVADPAKDGILSWALDAGTGTLEITLRAREDAQLQSYGVGAYEPGTGTTQSNSVTTTIVAQ